MSTNSNNSATAATADSKKAVELLPTEVRCSYPSKLCNKHRAVKDNGDLHKLCDFHRKKANVNQQRMQQKRRLIRQEMLKRKKDYMVTQSPMDYYDATDSMGPKERFISAAQAVMDYNTVSNMSVPRERFISAAQAIMDYNITANTNEPICNLTTEEVMMLEVILFDDDDDEGSSGASAQATSMAYQTNATYAPGMSSGNMSV